MTTTVTKGSAYSVVTVCWVAVAGSLGCVNSGGTPALDAGSDAAEPTLTNADNNPFPCLNPVPHEDFGLGYFRCDNGLVIHPQAVTCPVSEFGEVDECRTAADCGETFCNCATRFTVRNYCKSGSPGDCNSDGDCDPGFHCARVVIGFSDWAIAHMRCQRPSDQCASGAQCVDGHDAGTTGRSGFECQADDLGTFCCDRRTGCQF